MSTLRAVNTLKGHTNYVYHVAFGPDSRTLLTASADGTVRIWDAQRVPGETSFAAGGSQRIVFHPVTGKLLTSGDPVSEVDPSTGRTRPYASVRGTRIALSADGRTLATVADPNCNLCIWDGLTGTLRETFKAHDDAIRCVAVSSNGSLIATGGTDGTAKIWSAPAGRLIRTIKPKGENMQSLAFAPDGKAVAASATAVKPQAIPSFLLNVRVASTIRASIMTCGTAVSRLLMRSRTVGR